LSCLSNYLQVNPAPPVAVKRGFITDIPEIMQVPDAFMVSIGRYLCDPSDLITKSLKRACKIMFLPILYQGSVKADMGNTYPSIIFDGFEKSRQRLKLLQKNI
jgi:hypothetical protein